MKDCFAIVNRHGVVGTYCDVLDYGRVKETEVEEMCGTRKCPFYKPKECKDWIRLDTKRDSWIYPPEEYYQKRNAGRMKGEKL